MCRATSFNLEVDLQAADRYASFWICSVGKTVFKARNMADNNTLIACRFGINQATEIWNLNLNRIKVIQTEFKLIEIGFS